MQKSPILRKLCSLRLRLGSSLELFYGSNNFSQQLFVFFKKIFIIDGEPLNKKNAFNYFELLKIIFLNIRSYANQPEKRLYLRRKKIWLVKK